jgi:hypothetical protein
MEEITKVSIEPKWGLYNGAIGTVVDAIVWILRSLLSIKIEVFISITTVIILLT